MKSKAKRLWMLELSLVFVLELELESEIGAVCACMFGLAAVFESKVLFVFMLGCSPGLMLLLKSGRGIVIVMI